MKLHTDGTLEGTPEEIAAYMILKEPKQTGSFIPAFQQGIKQAPSIGNPLIPWTTTGVDAGKYPGDGTIYTTNQPSEVMYQPGDIIPMTMQEAARIRNGEDINEMLRKRKDQVDIQLNK